LDYGAVHSKQCTIARKAVVWESVENLADLEMFFQATVTEIEAFCWLLSLVPAGGSQDDSA